MGNRGRVKIQPAEGKQSAWTWPSLAEEVAQPMVPPPKNPQMEESHGNKSF